MKNKMSFFRSLRGQLIAITLVLIAFLFALIGVLQYVFMKDVLYSNKAESLQAQLMALPPDPNFFRPLPEQWKQEEKRWPEANDRPIIFQPGLTISYITKNGQAELLSSLQEDTPPVITAEQYEQIMQAANERQLKKYYVYSTVDSEQKMVVFRPLRTPDSSSHALIQASFSVGSLQSQLYSQLYIYIGTALLALITAIFLALPLLKRALRPLTKIIAKVEHTDVVNLSEHLPIEHRQIEMNLLAQAYNNMLTRLDASFEAERETSEKMKQFIADASHELRTPLTSIQGFIEVLQRGAVQQPNQLANALQAMDRESKRMSQLVEHLLQLAKLDDNQTSKHAVISLTSLLTQWSEQLQLLGRERQLSVEIDTVEAIHVLGNEDQLKQVILNIVQNAVQYTAADNGKITITLSQQDQQACIQISDNGVGIEQQYIGKLFQRFFRVEHARSRVQGGAGLGLAISKSIIDAHDGQIDVISEPGVGTRFSITLPLYCKLVSN